MTRSIPIAALAITLLSMLGLFSNQVHAQEQSGGTLQIATTADPVFNWFQHSSLPTLYMHKTFYNSLARISGETMEPEPDLAESWEPSEGGKVWTFYLREDVVWHDGQPFTADDVLFTYETITGPDSPRREVRLDTIDTIEVLDDYTVRFTFTNAVAPAPLNLSFNVPIMPRHRLEDVDIRTDTSFNQAPIGTGPYRFAEQERGSHVILEAFEDYFKGRPNIDRLVFRVVPDINSQIAQLRSGQIDVAVVEPTHLNALQGDSRITIHAAEGTTYFYLAFNTRKPPFDDVLVRRALSLAVDRSAIVDAVLSGYATPAVGPVPPALERYFHPDLEPVPFDPEQAERLLDEAGWERSADGTRRKDGEALRVTILTDRGNPTRERIAALAQQYWNSIGVDTQLEALEWSTFADKYQQQWDESGVRPWDVALVWIGLAPDPDGTREFHSQPGAIQGARWGYRNAEVDRLLEAGLAETDLDARAAIYHDFQEVINEDAPLAFLYYPQELTAVRTGVQGIPPLGGLRVSLAHIEEWYIEQ